MAAAILVVVVMSRIGSPSSSGGQGLVDGTADTPTTSVSELSPIRNGEQHAEAYPRTPEGAVAAATAYSLALDRPEAFDPRYRSDVLDDIAADAARDELDVALAEGLGRITEHLGVDEDAVTDPGFVWRAVPGGWQLRDFGESTATVAIWGAAVAMADNRLLVEPGWNTTEVTLSWERGGWRLVAFDTQPGPNPMFVTDSDGERIGEQINAFAPYRHWPHHLDVEGSP